jgi:hypothetical protein
MKTKPLKMKAAKAKAWKAFSLYIRTRDSINGMCSCITCGKVIPIKEAHASHFLGGRSNAVLFDEEAVYASCVGCNMFLHGNYTQYTLKMIDRYGRDWVDAKIAQKHQIVKYKTQDFQEIEKKYKQKLQELENL